MSDSVPPPPAPMPSNRGGSSNGIGVAALVCGIVGIPLAFCWIGVALSILAVIFGALGIKRFNHGHAPSKGMAKAGLILGIIGIAIFVLFLILALAINFNPNMLSS